MLGSIMDVYLESRSQYMKLRTRTICFAFLLGLAFAMAGCSGKKEKPKEIRDINAVRAELRAQVDQGKLIREEAIVQLAEAQAKFGARERKKKRKPSPELQVLGEELKKKVDEGHMTGEEAKAAWMEAAGKAKSKASAKKKIESTEVKK